MKFQPVVRRQWMRLTEQRRGSQESVYKLTSRFMSEFRDLIDQFAEGKNWTHKWMWECVEKGDHYVNVKVNDDETFIGEVEGDEMLTARPAVAFFSLDVDDFTERDAIEWGDYDDEDIYGFQCSGDELDAWFRYNTGEIKRWGAHKGVESSVVNYGLDDYRVALFATKASKDSDPVGFLGKGGRIVSFDRTFIFGSPRIASRVAMGCMFNPRKSR